MKNSFNLIDEKWIPIRGSSMASLGDIFSPEGSAFTELGGNALVKLSIFKLLLAIVQASGTPEDGEDWEENSPSAMCATALDYLKKNHHRFFLYGEKPFLQMRGMEKAKVIPLQRLVPNVASEGENRTAFRRSEFPRLITHSERAQIVVKEGGFSFGGKVADKNIVLSEGHSKKSACCGPCLGAYGVLHSFVIGGSLQESLYSNIVSMEDIENLNFDSGLGIPPWEEMPQGEIDEIANNLRDSYIGRLIPISRFLLLKEDKDEIHYSEGIPYPKLNEGYYDPSMTISNADGKVKTIWAKVNKRPWRSASALLSFLDKDENKQFHNFQLGLGFKRLRERYEDEERQAQIAIWSAGLHVNSNSGEQYVTQDCDYIDSIFTVPVKEPDSFKVHMDSSLEILEKKSSSLYGCIQNYSTAMGMAKPDNGKIASQIQGIYWIEVEPLFFNHLKELRTHPMEGGRVLLIMKQFDESIRRLIARLYDGACSHDTARQVLAWARNHPSQILEKRVKK